MEVPTMVIKVKYQEMMRRFHVRVAQGEIDLDMDRLRKKILTIFNLTPNADLMLTYIDEDGDEVALVDDDDLCDVAKQRLDSLRITVKLNSGKNGTRHRPSAISTPLKSQCMQQPLENDREVLKTVPDPFYGAIMHASSYHDLNEYLQHPDVTQSSMVMAATKIKFLEPSKVHGSTLKDKKSLGYETENSTAATKTNNLEPSKVDGAILKDTQSLGCENLENRNEKQFSSSALEKFLFHAGVIMEDPPGFNDVALESQNFSISKAMPDILDKKEMVEMIAECPVNGKPSVISYSPTVPNVDSFIEKIRRARTFSNENAIPKLNLSASDPIQLDVVGGRTNLGSWAPCHAISKLPDLCYSPNSPISRRPLQNVKSFQSHPPSRTVTCNGCKSQIVDFHCGIFCDGCGVHPITGPRFKSKVKEDYDLCMICYAERGNASDYMRIDRPMVYPHHVLYDSHGSDGDSVSSQDSMVFKVKSCLSKMDCCFIKDVTIADDTVMAPLTPFTKIWRLKNNGIVAWPKRTIICWTGGHELSNELSVELKIPATGLAINQELDVAVDCIAPELPGKYESFWQLASPSGQRFGRRFWIRIEVVASVAAKPQEYIRRFNLNFPPLNSLANGPQMSNAVPEPYTAGESTEDEERSFKSADLNETVSNMSEDILYLDDVSAFSEWETILDELFEMGFYDKEMNMRLLEKNNGSISHVVMEHIAAECDE